MGVILHYGTTLMTPFNLSHLCKRPISKYVILWMRTSAQEFEGNSIQSIKRHITHCIMMDILVRILVIIHIYVWYIAWKKGTGLYNTWRFTSLGCPASFIKLVLVIYFTYANVHVSKFFIVPVFQSICSNILSLETHESSNCKTSLT